MQGLAIRIRQGVIQELVRLARLEPVHECCGLLGGSGGVIAHTFEATNAAQNLSTAYEIAPQELFSLVRKIRSAGLELMGIYHSHPNGKNEPSPRDIELASYPDTAYIVVSPQPDAPRPVRAFSIRDGRAAELDIEMV